VVTSDVTGSNGSEPIALRGLTPFATGDHRLCFQHPAHPEWCIKVNRAGKDQALWDKAPFFKKLRSVRSFNDNWQEYQSFQQPAVNRHAPSIWRHIPRCYGWVPTDLGDGLVTDYFTGKDSQPAPTLTRYLEDQGLTEELQKAISEFLACLRKTLLITKNLLPHNILVVAGDSNDIRLVLIDGFGSLSRLPVYRLEGLARRYVEKRIKRFFVRLNWELSDKAITWEEAQKRNLGSESDFL
jgi:PhoP regulatory network protein YrbL